MKNNSSKIALLFVFGAIFYSCSVVKRVPDGKNLLTKVDIRVNDKKENNEILVNQLYQKPNTKLFFGFPLKLQMYNLAKVDAESSYNTWLARNPERHKRLAALLSEKQVQRLGKSFLVSGLSEILKKNGEEPVILNELKAQKTKNRFLGYYFNKGYFNTKVGYKIDTLGNKKATITYSIKTGKPYFIDTLKATIETPELDTLYETSKHLSFIKTGNQYDSRDLSDERKRISNYFRNNGVFRFQETYISYNVDTLNHNYKANVDVIIDNQTVKQGDSLIKVPFKIYKISEVNIFTDNKTVKDRAKVADSITYNNFKIYSSDKLAYRPKAITDAIFITKGSKFSDTRRLLTSRAISNLRIFNYPSIQYIEDKRDTTGHSLIANIILVPRKKYSFNVSADFMHSNIQDFGIAGTLGLSIRNVFRGAEILEISTRGNIGSSKDLANPNDVFFNISEYGADIKLSIPRIIFPIRTEKIIPKMMFPNSIASFGISRQRNIGLDKENFTGILSYNWFPKKNNSARLDLFNVQYVRNLNPQNYFSVYNSSYETLNDLAQDYNVDPGNLDQNGNLTIDEGGANNFIDDVLNGNTTLDPEDENYKTVKSIEERRMRLTENNLIFALNYTFTKSTKNDITDKNFYIFKTKIETAGNTLSLLSSLKKEDKTENGKKTFFNVEYSQYLKTEVDFIKHWDFGKKSEFAMRGFAGIAIPYGNSNNIPFSRSYFGGGSNDNRAWQSYDLGPGRSGSINDFNEANMKLAFSGEYRFNITGKWNGGLFVDVGNIWNVFDDVEDERFTFNGFESLKDLAVGSGVGIRYDFNFFIFRTDFGFKTYNPAYEMGERWFRDIRFDKAVINIGINYPF